jgi:hypothetical protein
MSIENKENDLGFIKINIDLFKEIYNNYNDEINNENLEKKAKELITTYNCFISNYDAKSLWEKKKLIAQKKNSKFNNVRNNKPRVLLIDFSDEMKCKKEFTSYLNKLTDVNKDIIYNKISVFIKELNEEILNSLFDVLINFIKISSNNIYIDVLFLFDHNYIISNVNTYLNLFIENKEWLPKDIIIDSKILFNNDNYDKYCSYVKLKKHTLSIIKALMIIIKKINNNTYFDVLLTNIYNDLDYNIKSNDNNNNKHIIELLLDELIILMDSNYNKNIINKLNEINLNDFEYSTKFKIQKILDIYRNND